MLFTAQEMGVNMTTSGKGYRLNEIIRKISQEHFKSYIDQLIRRWRTCVLCLGAIWEMYEIKLITLIVQMSIPLTKRDVNDVARSTTPTSP